MYIGKEKLILKHLGFLVNQYKMKYSFQSFKEYRGFNGPIDYYSFYNKNGCLTFQHIVQRGEWGWFVSKKYSNDQYLLLEQEISQKNYITKRIYSLNGMFKELARVLQEEIQANGTIFNIKIEL